jgi:hypothetical protein
MLKGRLRLDQPTDDVLVLDRKGNEAEQARVNDFVLAQHQVSSSGWGDQPQNPLRRPTRLAIAAARSRWGRVRKTHDAAKVVLQRLTHCDTDS